MGLNLGMLGGNTEAKKHLKQAEIGGERRRCRSTSSPPPLSPPLSPPLPARPRPDSHQPPTSSSHKERHCSQAGLEGNALIFSASAIAGFFASAFSLPFDYVKTQIQKQKPDAAGRLQYASSADCALQTLRAGGPLRFYAGFPTYYFRIAPHAMITLVAADKVKQAWKRMGV